MTRDNFLKKWPAYTAHYSAEFLADIDAMIAAAVAEEREACAPIAGEVILDRKMREAYVMMGSRALTVVADEIEKRIRARGK